MTIKDALLSGRQSKVVNVATFIVMGVTAIANGDNVIGILGLICAVFGINDYLKISEVIKTVDKQ